MPVPQDFRVRFAAAIKNSLEPVKNDLTLYEAGDEIVPGLTTIVASGHTPGMATFLRSFRQRPAAADGGPCLSPGRQRGRALGSGPGPRQEAALASRRRIFDRAATDRIPVLGFHFPFPGLGRLLKTDGAYAWVPANWQF